MFTPNSKSGSIFEKKFEILPPYQTGPYFYGKKLEYAYFSKGIFGGKFRKKCQEGQPSNRFGRISYIRCFYTEGNGHKLCEGAGVLF